MVNEVAAVFVVRCAEQPQVVACIASTGRPRHHMIQMHVLLEMVIPVWTHRAAAVVAVPDGQPQVSGDRLPLTAADYLMTLSGAREALLEDLAQ